MACLAIAEPLVGLGAIGGRGHYIHTPVHPNIYLTLGEREGEGERERALGGGKEGGPAASLQVRKLVGAT